MMMALVGEITVLSRSSTTLPLAVSLFFSFQKAYFLQTIQQLGGRLCSRML